MSRRTAKSIVLQRFGGWGLGGVSVCDSWIFSVCRKEYFKGISDCELSEHRFSSLAQAVDQCF
jgi:hypothetical protein